MVQHASATVEARPTYEKAPEHADQSSLAESVAVFRRLPVRIADPPFDDEIDESNADLYSEPGGARIGDAAGAQTALALPFALPSGLTAIPEPPRLRLVPSISGESESAPSGPPDRDVDNPLRPSRRRIRKSDVDEFGPLRTPRDQLPEPRPWAGRLVQALVEVSAGLRPAAQLVRWTTTDVYDRVHRLVTYDVGAQRGGRRSAVIVRSVHVSEPLDGVAEVCAVIQRGARCAAVALRLEGIDGRWQCTALHIG